MWQTDAAWINHALVLARYLLPALALYLLLTVLGVSRLITLARLNVPAQVCAAGALLLLHASAGPLPETYSGRNQFTGHMRFQFDYVLERNPYNVLENLDLAPVFTRIGEEFEPGETTVIMAPWFYEWHFSMNYRFQEVHQQPVKMAFTHGMCSGFRPDEYPVDAQGLQFEHFTHLSTLLAGSKQDGILVLRRKRPYWIPEARWPEDWVNCLGTLSESLGDPWHEDEEFIAYRLGGSRST